MKKILALSSAVLALFTAEVSATRLNIYELNDLAEFGATIKETRAAIGVRQQAGADLATSSVSSALEDARARLIGDNNAAVAPYTIRANLATGRSATVVNGIDYFEDISGTSEAFDTFRGLAAAVFQVAFGGGPVSVVGAGTLANDRTNNYSTDLVNSRTPAIVDIDGVAGLDNTVVRTASTMAIIYNRLVRQEDGGVADAENAAARRVRLQAANNALFGDNTVPTLDQFNLLHLAHYLFNTDSTAAARI